MKEDRASKQPMLNGSPKKIQHKVYKIVLTGGPCGGKTTGQVRLSNFFENLGWKVYRAPETAFVLMSGGVKWTDLDENQAINFQEDIGRMMLMVEDSYTRLAEGGRRNAIIICDRGVMDGSAFLRPDQWQAIMARNGWNPIMLRDQRYNQIIHMVSAAEGAEEFYTTDQHATRYESSEQARELDKRAAQAWVGHPYYDVVDNSTDFETKVTRMIGLVCERMGIQVGDRLARNSIKRKFLVKRLPPGMKDFSMPSGGGSSSEKADAEAAAGAASDEESSSQFPAFEDFDVVHDYLVTPHNKTQARLRRRGQNGQYTYTHTIRRPEINNQSVELKIHLASREYINLLAQKDNDHHTIHKVRRCFLWDNQYFQMDIYQEPCPASCAGLIILETYTTKMDADLKLPDFLQIERETTGNPDYSMFNLSLKADDEKRLRSFSGSDVNRTSPNSLNRRLRTVSDCGLGPQEGAVNGLDDRRYDDVHGVKNPRSPCTPPPVE